LIAVFAYAGPLCAQTPERSGALSETTLPGGLRGALAAIDDRAAADHGQFLLEFIRRTYSAPIREKTDKTDTHGTALRSLLAYFDSSSRENGARAAAAETVPLPWSAAIWADVVFGGRETGQNLVSAILRSRATALLYHGSLSLDETTRAWLGTQPELLTDLVSRHSVAFVVAAPGLRVADGSLRVPGGEAAVPVWEALVGRRVREPADFVRALLAQREGRLAYFYSTMAQLTPAQALVALNLAARDPAARVAAARRLYAIFEHLSPNWRIDQQTFWRPSIDPALLLADLRADDRGQPIVPGTRRFWSAVFAEADDGHASEDDPRALIEGDAVDFGWLCEQIFASKPGESRRRYEIVMFASRFVTSLTPDTARDGVEAVRAAERYPTLVAALERAKVRDVTVFARAARRAARISAIGDDGRAARALAQFQGLLVLVTRAAARGSLPPDSLPGVVSSLCAIDLGKNGDYEGRLVRWLEAFLADPRSAPRDPVSAAGSMEQELLQMLAGPVAIGPRVVEWEGTRYRLDLARAEMVRLERLLGDHPRPSVSSARTLVDIADALSVRGLTREGLTLHAEAFARVARAFGWDETESRAPNASFLWQSDRGREAAAAFARLVREGDIRGAARLEPALRVLADDLLARGLVELAYAVALGQSDRAAVAASEAARRHEFDFRSGGAGPAGPWQLPSAGSEILRGWHVTGSLLGLDVSLAELSLTRLSSKLPPRKPALNDRDRRALVETVAIIEPALLTDGDRDTIVGAIQRGRTRLAALRTADQARAFTNDIPLSAARRTLLPWIVAHDPQRVTTFLSPMELFWLGLEGTTPDPRLNVWGAPGEPRFGCLCLRLLDRQPPDTLAGRWRSGILASAFPDLNLRLAELLSDLKMPAPLLGPVLASATFDLVYNAISRDEDDRRGLVDFVQALRVERLEEYLALLTTDGPLVPVDDSSEPAVAAGSIQRREVR
jgi:hypothetical protein